MSERMIVRKKRPLILTVDFLMLYAMRRVAARMAFAKSVVPATLKEHPAAESRAQSEPRP